MLTYNEITKNEAIKTYIIRADESLGALGFTEHSFAHVMHVAETAGYILKTLGHDERTIELAKIAGYLHDIGNLVNRKDHAQSGAVMAWSILNDMDCDLQMLQRLSQQSETTTKVPEFQSTLLLPQ